MIDTTNIKTHYKWEIAPRDAKETRWTRLYATLNQRGEIWLTRRTHEALGAPEAYLVKYDAEAHVVGLEPTRAGAKNAYPAHARGTYGGRRIHAHRAVSQFSLYLNATERFPRCFIDHSGTLILDLKDVITVGRNKKKGYGY